MPTEKFAIVLRDDEDTDIRLTEPSAEKWIESEFTPPSSLSFGYYEPIPAKLLSAYPEYKGGARAHVSSGSYENDRALACPGMQFSTLKEMTDYMREHDIVLSGEFIGQIY